MFISFCSFTDGNLSDDEFAAIGDEIAMLSRVFKLTDEQRKQAIADACTMNAGCPTGQEKADLFCKVLDQLKLAECKKISVVES